MRPEAGNGHPDGVTRVSNGEGGAMAEIKPEATVRRFDVFAEVNRLKALREGRPEDEAKGYGVWLAKVVAARRFGPTLKPTPPRDGQTHGEHVGGEEEPQEPKFKSVGGARQTDA